MRGSSGLPGCKHPWNPPVAVKQSTRINTPGDPLGERAQPGGLGFHNPNGSPGQGGKGCTPRERRRLLPSAPAL